MTTPPDDVVEAMNKYKSPETVVLSREDFKNSLSTHTIYTPDGMHCATAEATGVWIGYDA
ncbi:hypothetical protein [Chryseobacterium sp. CH1]|uniref:hypothetical protein n=1 Tax=Chryseobacterium sp. CH1 TaxID=713551 RepID=UPI001E2F99C0|nr:hypothetical protein [Chryseobacterium sp. CH1]